MAGVVLAGELKGRPLVVQSFPFDFLDPFQRDRKLVGDGCPGVARTQSRVLGFDESPKNDLPLIDGEVIRGFGHANTLRDREGYTPISYWTFTKSNLKS